MLKNQRLFLHIIANQILSGTATSFVWFALIFWAFLETDSILVTSLIAGIFGITNAITAFPFGWMVDHYKKKSVLLISSSLSTLSFIGAYFLLTGMPESSFQNISSPVLWILIIILLFGSIAGNLRMICLNPIVSMLFEADERAKQNGLIGVSNGISFTLTSVLSGLSIGLLGMEITLLLAISALSLSIVYLSFIPIPELKLQENAPNKLDTPEEKTSTLKLIRNTSGFIGLMLFAILNNLLGGVFMALMDAYGLSLVSVESWGFLWGLLSLVTIVGGMVATKYGIGKDPVKTLILLNLFTWISCILFPLKASIVLLGLGGIVWMFCFPIVETAEQTIIQKVIPIQQQGRVVGLMQSLENAIAPLTSLLIGPITAFWIVPFMTTGKGAEWIGSWFGTGQDRAMALVFIMAGVLGTLLSVGSYFSKTRKKITALYQS